jgi:hypothetical protein
MLPDFEFNMKTKLSRSTLFPSIELSSEVLWQLRDLISVIACMVCIRGDANSVPTGYSTSHDRYLSLLMSSIGQISFTVLSTHRTLPCRS